MSGTVYREPSHKRFLTPVLDLNQLARHWQQDIDAFCELVARAAVVYLDETSWKINADGCSLWALQSLEHTVLKFGCRKDDATLDQLLPPEVFAGVAVSDDAAVYRGRLSAAGREREVARLETRLWDVAAPH